MKLIPCKHSAVRRVLAPLTTTPLYLAPPSLLVPCCREYPLVAPFRISKCPTERSQARSTSAAHIKGYKIKSNQMKCAYVWRFMRRRK